MGVYWKKDSLKKLNQKKQETTTVKTTVENLENALCEIDEANAERMAAIEDALCEIDGGAV